MGGADFPPMVWPDGSLIEIGQKVRCEREAPAKGSWRKFDGKVGVVGAVVATITESGRTVWIGEVGVDLGDRVGLVWFRPDELVLRTSVTGSERPLSAALTGVG